MIKKQIVSNCLFETELMLLLMLKLRQLKSFSENQDNSLKLHLIGYIVISLEKTLYLFKIFCFYYWLNHFELKRSFFAITFD